MNIGRQEYEPDPEEEAFYAARPRIAVAFDAAVGHLADDGDRRALVLALVEHMPPEGVAELLARLIEGHPEGAGMVRVQDRWQLDGGLVLRGIAGGRAMHGWVLDEAGGWRAMCNDGTLSTHPTREAAEAALIAAQPVPAAVVRVRE